MKKHLISTFLILLLFGISGYLISDYFLKRLDEQVILKYRVLAVLNKTQEMRYHLTSINKEFLSFRQQGGLETAIQKKIDHALLETDNLNTLLLELQEHESVLKQYALRAEPMERAVIFLNEKSRQILATQDPDERRRHLEEAIAYGEQVDEVMEAMEVKMDTEAQSTVEEVAAFSTKIRWYRTIFLAVEFGVLLFFVVIFIRHTRNRLRQTIRMIQEIPGGKGEEILGTAEQDKDLRVIASELSALMNNIEKNEKKLEEMTTVDPLTGLYNRRYFQERLDAEFKRFVRYNTLFSIAIVDVDHFKRINDTYGHQQGDEVLKEVAGILRSRTRETDILARYGGEEFVILYTSTEKGGAYLHIDRIRLSISEHLFRGLSQKVTISAGISDATGRTSSDEVINQADAALYQAKDSGRNRCEVYYARLGGTVGEKGMGKGEDDGNAGEEKAQKNVFAPDLNKS
ncbi:MAG: GGDEF domain-containing protein [Nitrospirae bacterium]|nr:GGDEF domain-containing protein [Nitrospirota bacterium]